MAQVRILKVDTDDVSSSGDLVRRIMSALPMAMEDESTDKQTRIAEAIAAAAGTEAITKYLREVLDKRGARCYCALLDVLGPIVVATLNGDTDSLVKARDVLARAINEIAGK